MRNFINDDNGDKKPNGFKLLLKNLFTKNLEIKFLALMVAAMFWLLCGYLFVA